MATITRRLRSWPASGALLPSRAACGRRAAPLNLRAFRSPQELPNLRDCLNRHSRSIIDGRPRAAYFDRPRTSLAVVSDLLLCALRFLCRSWLALHLSLRVLGRRSGVAGCIVHPACWRMLLASWSCAGRRRCCLGRMSRRGSRASVIIGRSVTWSRLSDACAEKNRGAACEQEIPHVHGRSSCWG